MEPAVARAPLPPTERRPSGCRLPRLFSRPGEDPYASVEWSRRDAVIVAADGDEVFRLDGVETPAAWSDMATRVVASRYLHGAPGDAGRETSVRQLVARVVDTITAWGLADGYFAEPADADAFHDELVHVLLHQVASFNSPVWFNVGIDPDPQCSACFILAVEDTLGSILELAATEARLFKHGSGTGSNLSSLRSSREPLSGGGTASGPVSFMRGFDAFAGVIKSGGKTRRAAKMVLLDVEHPDVEAFVSCKADEEETLRLLHGASLHGAGLGRSAGAAADAQPVVGFQNANHTLRLSDDFLRAVEAGGDWTTRAVVDGHAMDRLDARALLRTVAAAAWSCGDPGVQFADTIDAWHTCPASGRIRASNPCSEFVFLDDSACNLASVALRRFDGPAGFDVAAFTHVCRVMLTAQEILVDRASYPTPEVAANARRFRPLGLGYADLGALLMSRGLAYDSDRGRALAAAVTALMTGTAYAWSARLAAARGAFAAFPENREAMLGVVRRHRAALAAIDREAAPPELVAAAAASWRDAEEGGTAHGYRNAQVSLLAPTGTIAFMMDCDTTGIEPELALVKHRRLEGGGELRIVNRTVATALESLGYDAPARSEIVGHVERRGTAEGAPGLADEHLAVFDCALRPRRGHRVIAPHGHLAMMAAVQPFLSGAISKTINLPAEATVETVEELFLAAWRLGLKAVTVYRDGCKSGQPLTAEDDGAAAADDDAATAPRASDPRRRLPDERRAITHKFSIAEHEGYLTVGLYDDGQPGEIFLVMAKEGSTISGLMDAFATAVSIALQYGVPLAALVQKFSHARFEPAGWTRNPQIPIAKSIIDYIFHWLATKFLDEATQRALGIVRPDIAPLVGGTDADDAAPPPTGAEDSADAPSCHACGELMTRNGACYQCPNCGVTSGCG